MPIGALHDVGSGSVRDVGRDTAAGLNLIENRSGEERPTQLRTRVASHYLPDHRPNRLVGDSEIPLHPPYPFPHRSVRGTLSERRKIVRSVI